MQRQFFLLLLLAFLALYPSATVFAQDADGLKLPPSGTTVMNLSATETEKVGQDMVVASLRVEADEADAKAVQARINTAMQNALARAKKETEIKTSTGAYSVYPYDPNPEPPKVWNERRTQRWRGQQTIEMQSLDSEAVLKLTGELQQMGFVMNNLGYTLSPEKYESVQDGLLVKALGKLTAKADLAAKTLKKSGYDMLNVDLNAGGYAPPIYARAAMMEGAMMDKSMPAPVVAAGETDVSLTVSARVLLKP